MIQKDKISIFLLPAGQRRHAAMQVAGRVGGWSQSMSDDELTLPESNYWFSFASLDTLLILFCFSWYSLDSLLLLLILSWFSFASLDTLLILFCFSWYSFDSLFLLFILSWFNESTFKGLRRNYQGDSLALESSETTDVSHNEFCVRETFWSGLLVYPSKGTTYVLYSRC